MSQRLNTSHLEEDHTNVAVFPAQENTFDIEYVGTFSGMYIYIYIYIYGLSGKYR